MGNVVLTELQDRLRNAEEDRENAIEFYNQGMVDAGDASRREAEIGFLNVIARALVALVGQR